MEKKVTLQKRAQKNDYLLALEWKDASNAARTISVSITPGEMAVIKSIFNQSIPHLLCWGSGLDPTIAAADAQPDSQH